MKATIINDLEVKEYKNVVQLSINYNEAIDNLQMPQVILLSIIQNKDEKKKTLIELNDGAIVTVVEGVNS